MSLLISAIAWIPMNPLIAKLVMFEELCPSAVFLNTIIVQPTQRINQMERSVLIGRRQRVADQIIRPVF